MSSATTTVTRVVCRTSGPDPVKVEGSSNTTSNNAGAAVPISREREGVVLVFTIDTNEEDGQIPGPKLIQSMSAVLSTVINTIVEHEGVVQSFDLSHVVATFNIARPVENACRSASHAALAIATAVKDVPDAQNSDWGIGLAAGTVLAGDFGTTQLRQHLAFGQPVRLATDLAALNAVLGTKILVSEAVNDATRKLLVTMVVDVVKLREQDAATTPVYELVGETMPDDVDDDAVEYYLNAFAAFRQGDFKAADLQMQCIDPTVVARTNNFRRLSGLVSHCLRHPRTVAVPYFRLRHRRWLPHFQGEEQPSCDFSSSRLTVAARIPERPAGVPCACSLFSRTSMAQLVFDSSGTSLDAASWLNNSSGSNIPTETHSPTNNIHQQQLPTALPTLAPTNTQHAPPPRRSPARGVAVGAGWNVARMTGPCTDDAPPDNPGPCMAAEESAVGPAISDFRDVSLVQSNAMTRAEELAAAVTDAMSGQERTGCADSCEVTQQQARFEHGSPSSATHNDAATSGDSDVGDIESPRKPSRQGGVNGRDSQYGDILSTADVSGGANTVNSSRLSPPQREKRTACQTLTEEEATFVDCDRVVWRRSSTVLGRGTFGEVVLGMRQDDGKLVAMKWVPLPEPPTERQVFSPTQRNDGRFRSRAGGHVSQLVAEIALLCRLRHENIVSFLGCAVVGNRLVLNMEYVAGGSLQTVVEQFGKIPLAATQRYLRDILRGLQYLHEQGIVHRDIKPGNVLLHIDGTCKLTDFGTATNMKTIAGGGNLVVGTPLYMSPEQARGATSTTFSSDLWSVGVLSIQLLTGVLPFDITKGTSVHRLLHDLVNNPDFKIIIPASIPPIAVPFVQQCLQRDPHQRGTARDLLHHPFLNAPMGAVHRTALTARTEFALGSSAWMLEDDCRIPDKRQPCMREPNISVPMEVIRDAGALYWKVDPQEIMDPNSNALQRICKDMEYKNQDEITISPAALPDYENLLKVFWTEHMHEDDEVRLIVEGEGYFDLRSVQDEWMRVYVKAGDFLHLPAGLYHRFTVTTTNFIRAYRLFKLLPKWTALMRPAEDHPSRVAYVESLAWKRETILGLTNGEDNLLVTAPSHFEAMLFQACAHDNHTAVIVYFTGVRHPGTNKSWCQQCITGDAVVKETLLAARLRFPSMRLVLLECVVDCPSFRSNIGHPYRSNRIAALQMLPTLMVCVAESSPLAYQSTNIYSSPKLKDATVSFGHHSASSSSPLYLSVALLYRQAAVVSSDWTDVLADESSPLVQ